MITRNFFEQMTLSEERYKKSESTRRARDGERKKRADRGRKWEIIDSRERFVRRLKSKGMIGEARAVEEWTGAVPLGFDPLERILEQNELTSATTLYQGAAQTHSIGRVVIRTATGHVAGYGTGFLVSPRLLLTNNHVLESAGEARQSAVEFFHWEDLRGRSGEKLEFALDPDHFFETDAALDFSLVAVKERSGPNRLSDLGWTPLIGDSGKAAVGEPVNVIQHPRGGDQKVVLRQNKIVDVVDDGFLHYEADTQRGSSGSPVYNVDWELAALHHSSVPKRDGQGRILLRGNVVWNGDRAFIDQIQWVANEGVRISSIVAELRRRAGGWTPAESALFEESFSPAPSFDETVPGIGSRRSAQTADTDSPDDAGRGGDTSLRDLLLRLLGELDRRSEEGELDISDEAIDRDYSNRRGYQSGFLGSGRFRIRLPRPREGSDEQEGRTLPYHNFSVAMNPERRLARYTASNIHGRKLHHIVRADGQTGWIFDRRIPRSEQIGNDLYKNNPIDRGHLVRRLDAAWGRTRSEAMAGNDDTFHYTNSAPQHEELNEDDESWAGLEDHYLNHARAADRKISVFTGPVFRGTDPVFESPAGTRARIPRQFWKVVAYRRGGRLVADGYLLSQRQILRDDLDLEAFGGDQFQTFQVPIRRIEDLTDLDLSALRGGDTFGEGFEEGLESEAADRSQAYREIRNLEDIRLDDEPE